VDDAERCTARHQFGNDPLGYKRQCTRGTTGDDAGHGGTSNPHIDDRDPARWWADSVRFDPPDPRVTERRDHARQLRALIDQLEARGGDAVSVLLGVAERLHLGCDRYGPLNLDDPHDWQAEEDEELADVMTYRAIRRTLTRRGRPTRSAMRRATTDPDDASDPTWTGEGPRG